MARVTNGFLGNFTTTEELTAKFPPSEHAGCSANIGSAAPYSKAWSDGSTWNALASAPIQALVSDYGIAGSPTPAFTLNCTWATLPAAADFIGTAYISDVGARGSLWRSDGSTWGLVNGSVVLARGNTDLTVTAASTSEVDLVTVNIPAGLMGANGQLVVTHFWTANNSANVKTMRVKLGGTAFFANASGINSNLVFLPPPTRIWNRNSESSQISFLAGNGNVTVATSTVPGTTTGTINTAAATTLVISGQKATGSDDLILAAYSVELIRP